jgi:hypothetical protein
MTTPRTLVSTLALALLASAAFAQNGRFEKTISFPRSGEAKLDWSYEKCTITGVQVRNYPNEEDIEKARTKDKNDHSWLWWEFHIDNRSARDCKIRLWVEVLDKEGRVLKADDRSGSVDAGKIDDDIRVSGRMRTLDAAEAPKVRLKAEIIPK